MSDIGVHGAAFGARAAEAAMQASGSTTFAPPALPATWKRAMEASSFQVKKEASRTPSSSSSSANVAKSQRPKSLSVPRSRMTVTGGAAVPVPLVLPPLPPPPPRVSFATQAKQGVARVVQSKLLTAIMVFLFTMVALLVSNPPMARDPHDPRQRSWGKMTTWSLLAFAAALALPWCFPTAQVVI
jgi:hypothetical protein